MPSLEVQTTRNAPVTITYPAEQAVGCTVMVRFRVGKKNLLPAYSPETLHLLVQFRTRRGIVVLLLSELVEPSYWGRIHKAYDWFDRLEIDTGLKLSRTESRRVVKWLTEQSKALGVSIE
jgi:hypothetical protein